MRGDGVRNELSGSAGNVVQARDIGQVILAARERPQAVPALAPSPPEAFTNREAELARLHALADTPVGDRTRPPVAALRGMPGVGKSALLRQAAWQLRERFPDGVLHVQYGQEGNSPAEAAARFLAALSVPEALIPSGFQARVDLYRSLTAGSRMIVVFDEVREAAQVSALLPLSPASLVLVAAGRQEPLEELHLDGAVDLPVHPLSTDHGVSLVANVCGAERVAAQRADVVKLVEVCGGLPLALGVAAAWLKTRPHLDVRQLVDDLRETDRDPGDASAERSARAKVFAMFDLAYADLPARVRGLYRLLGVLVGAHFGADVLAAMAELPVREVRRELDTLCQTGMVQQESAGVYRLHRLVRVHALRKAAAGTDKDERVAALRRAVGCWLRTAVAADVAIKGVQSLRVTDPATILGAEPVEVPAQAAMAWSRREQPNLLEVMDAAAEQGWHLEVCQLFEALFALFDATKPLAAWVRAGKRAVESALAGKHTAHEVRCRCLLAKAYQELGRFAEAHEQLGRARELAEGCGERLLASTEDFTGNVLLRQGKPAEALVRFRIALEINERLGRVRGTAMLSMMVGRALGALGEHEEALAAFARARSLVAGTDAESILPKILLSTAGVLAAAGADQDAERAFAEALEIAEQREATAPAADALLGLAELAERRGERESGLGFRRRAAALFQRMGVPDSVHATRTAWLLAGLPPTG
ncbi:tetratricopeptide repeat protein [Crossiella sp. NPDC003009]